MRNSIMFFLLCLLLFISLFFWQDVIELLAEEPRRAVVALEMQLTGDYLVPKVNGVNYYNKPPLFNWVIASFYSITGSYQEWVVRLPSLIAWIFLVIINFFIARPFIGKQAAILASLFTLTAADVYYYGAIYSGEIDLFFSLIVYLQVFSLFWFYYKRQLCWMYIVSYAFMGIGFLTKGLPSLAFQAMTLLGMAIFFRTWKWFFSWKHVLGILVFILPVGFYYFLYSTEADYLSYLINLVKEASQRTVLESKPADFIISIFKFPLDLVKLLLPWSLLVIFMITHKLKSIIWSNDLLKFVVLFILFNIPIYWLTGELRNRYLYMFIPFFMIILAYFYVHNRSFFPQTGRWIELIFSAIILILPFIFLIPLFIPLTRALPYYWVKSLLLFMLGAICAYFYFYRLKSFTIYLVIVGMILMRLAVNWFYLPAYQLNDKFIYYEREAAGIVALTGQEKIFFAGETRDYKPQLRLGPMKFASLDFTYPAYIPFQLSYYIPRLNGQVLEFTPSPLSGQLCLGSETFFVNRKYQVLYRYYDLRAKSDFLLVRLE